MSRPALLEALASLAPGPLSVTVSVITVGTSAVMLIGNDPERLCLVLANSGADAVAVSPDAGVTITGGVILPVNAPPLAWNPVDHFILPGVAWYAVSGTAGAKVTVISIRRI